MATILITGGTGTIGKSLSKFLVEKQHEVIILTRHPRQANGAVSYAAWDPANQTIDINALQKADYIINLAGAGVADKRWSKKRKQEIVDSRVQSGQLLVKAMQENTNKVKAVVSASGIGWYGDDSKRAPSQKFFSEGDPADPGFLGDTCVKWENAIKPVTALNKRLVIIRPGIVLSNEGGALAEFKKPIKAGIATFFGSGEQVLSWIHIDDLCRIIYRAIENERMSGEYNTVSPDPVTNKHLMLTLAKKMKGKFFIPVYVPAFLLKLAVGEVSIELLKSTTVSCEKIKSSGFQFLFPTLEVALDDLLKK
ncbi:MULTISPECIES: TIGR01777 family oxidoreductase [Niastella]|uniref:TIGR01777 family oxidoreductase n=1 Tax=Niastella soli TaxID=2821487 RepID=A0ABS3YU70_9BACT|nr:TIGR01777 family oxidoreductase [Niastella soli]MBO9200741.1 TIGR01777 family oxidoreductase [Niastella soli]